MARIVSSCLAIALMGALVALVGAGSHRAYGWFGAAACLLLVAAASMFSRAWRGFLGLGVFAFPWVALTTLLSTAGPGGSAPLIVADAHGLTWVYGGAAVIVVVGLLPRRLLVGVEEAAA
ncbi:hypothetical protein [Demequina gelatinilytica]|uniref:hypothetical protein n=1 Tax=Demequina gelatinilytica TaxID=1638980 RepID=UPI00078415FA|nr:hypothetical protein [Demequina gelatinilytica]